MIEYLVIIDIDLDFTTVLEQVLGFTVLLYRNGSYRSGCKAWVNKNKEYLKNLFTAYGCVLYTECSYE